MKLALVISFTIATLTSAPAFAQKHKVGKPLNLLSFMTTAHEPASTFLFKDYP